MMLGKTVSFLSYIGMLGWTMPLGCGGGDGGFDPSKYDFCAYLQNFGGEDLVPGIEIRVINNDTGQQTSQAATTDSKGWVCFNDLPAGLVGFLSVGVTGDWVDTYQFNIDSTAKSERLWVVSAYVYQASHLAAGLGAVDPTKAIVAGAVYWVDPQDPQKTEHIIGCSTVQADPAAGEVRYFDDTGYPTTLPNRGSVNPLNGYYLLQMDPGPKAVNAFVDSTEIGSTSLFTYADSISISNIYNHDAQNPMPAGCQ